METWATNPNYTPSNYDLNYFSSPEKDAFASILSGTSDDFIRAVISDDPEGIWNQFVEENKAQAEKACAEINEVFGK